MVEARGTALPGDFNQLMLGVRKMLSAPKIPPNALNAFSVIPNISTGGVDVAFTLSTLAGIDSAHVLRGSTPDAGQAQLIQTYGSLGTLSAPQAFTYPDASSIATVAEAFYWVQLNPQGMDGTPFLSGYQQLSLSPQLGAPASPSSISASHGAAAGGSDTVYVSVTGQPPGTSLRIYAAGYQGNAGAVLVASGIGPQLQFALQDTGETITLTAEAVSSGGTPSAPSASTAITLTASQSAPAAPPAPTVVQFAGGNQLTFPRSLEPFVTSYGVYRSLRVGGSFSTATLLGTVTTSSNANLTYTDSAGLNGDYAYYIVAVSTASSSAPSAPGTPLIIYSSAVLPASVAANTNSNAVLTPSTTSIGIAGPGGGSYVHYVGYGQSYTRPAGTVSGLSSSTKYTVVYNPATGSHLAFVYNSGTSLDPYELVGTTTTSAALPPGP